MAGCRPFQGPPSPPPTRLMFGAGVSDLRRVATDLEWDGCTWFGSGVLGWTPSHRDTPIKDKFLPYPYVLCVLM